MAETEEGHTVPDPGDEGGHEGRSRTPCSALRGRCTRLAPEEGLLSYLNGLIEQNGLAGKVILLDRVPNEKLPNYYSMSSVLVLPSYYEAFPKVLIEAMACRGPPSQSRMGGTQDSIRGQRQRLPRELRRPRGPCQVHHHRPAGRRAGPDGKGGAAEKVVRDFTWRAVARQGRLDLR